MKRLSFRICGRLTCVYIVLVAHYCQTAQNPPDCQDTWQWQWKGGIEPTVAITAPTSWPDTCVGTITVGPANPTSTPATRWQVYTGTCDPPKPNRYEGSVTPTVTNWWTLYERPEGTTPTSGSGTTAQFTTIGGGPVSVYFHTRGTVGYPAWEAETSARTPSGSPFRIFEVLSLLPNDGCEIDDFDGDPHTKAFAVHTGNGALTVAATPNPGVTLV